MFSHDIIFQTDIIGEIIWHIDAFFIDSPEPTFRFSNANN